MRIWGWMEGGGEITYTVKRKKHDEQITYHVFKVKN